MLPVVSASAADVNFTLEPISLSSLGVSNDNTSWNPSISDDGRYVAFSSYASNLVPGDTNGAADAFLYDRQLKSLKRISVTGDGVEGNDDVWQTQISGDGSRVVFETRATNMGGPYGAILVYNVGSGTLTRVDTSATGEGGNGGGYGPTISANGRYVVFLSGAGNLTPQSDFTTHWYLKDLATGAISMVDVTPAGTAPKAWEASCTNTTGSVSDDGRYVAIASCLSDVVSNDTNGASDVIVRDMVTGTSVIASKTAAGVQSNGISFVPTLSRDGRYLTFISTATNLVPTATSGQSYLYLKDLQTGSIEVASVDAAGSPISGGAAHGSISADGRYQVWVQGWGYVYLRDRLANSVTQVAAGYSNGHNFGPAVTPDGRFVAFFANQPLTPADTNGMIDVYVATPARPADTTPPVVTGSVSPAPNAAGWHNSDVTVTWTVADPESAIVTTCENVTITGETSGQTVTCQATNSAGLISAPVSVTVKVDRTAPVTQASEANGTVTLAATDNLSGVMATFYRVDGGEVQSGNAVTITTSGTHTVTYWSADQAANMEAQRSLTVTVDKTPPVTTATPPAPTGWVKEWTVRLTATDDLSGVAATYMKGYGPLVTYAEPGLTLNRTGIWDLQYWSVDGAGNIESPHDYSVMVDHHGPYIWATGGVTEDGSIRVFLGGADNQSGLDYLEWSLDHQTWQRYTGSFLLPPNFSGRLYYRGFDRLGNVTECVVDIRVITSEGGTYRVCGVSEAGGTVTVKVTDPATGTVYEMQVPADASGNWCTEIIVIGDCTCRLDIIGEGGSGGGGVLIDVKPPYGGGGTTEPKCGGCGWYGGGEDITITLKPTDGGGSGATKVEINTGGGGGWVEVPLTGGGGSYTIPGGSLGGGGHDILIRTTDGAGNSRTETIHVNIDVSGPDLGEPTWTPGSDRPTFTPVDGGSGVGGGWWDEVWDSHCGCIILIYRCKDKTGNESTFKLYPVKAEEGQWSWEGQAKEFSLGDLSIIPGTGPWSVKVWWGDGSDPELFTSNGGVLTRTHIYKDNGQYTATVLVFNGSLQGALVKVPITVRNLPPEITNVTGPTEPQLLGTPVTLTADFRDPGILDSHTATIEWGDGTPADTGIVHETLNTTGTGSVTFPFHTYAAPGVYTVKITVTDKDGESDVEFYTYIVIYDPNGGFVTGGGWIKVATGSYTDNPQLTGRANFGFVSKYLNGATVPSGQTEFQFQVAGLNFHSTAYEWLVVAGAKAQFKGTGTINGGGSYGFMLTAIDGQVNGTGTDKFRIKIWKLDGGAVVFDNQMGADETGDASTALSGGSIVIHHEK